ncbi:hypothetical protein OH77DRAFT_1420280 [Trametes cingulata]|nr:hypothetical protein OH77DRAFT_1420280 [Trametes cingulata]
MLAPVSICFRFSFFSLAAHIAAIPMRRVSASLEGAQTLLERYVQMPSSSSQVWSISLWWSRSRSLRVLPT